MFRVRYCILVHRTVSKAYHRRFLSKNNETRIASRGITYSAENLYLFKENLKDLSDNNKIQNIFLILPNFITICIWLNYVLSFWSFLPHLLISFCFQTLQIMKILTKVLLNLNCPLGFS